jgi:hypothetical protein
VWILKRRSGSITVQRGKHKIVVDGATEAQVDALLEQAAQLLAAEPDE